MTTPPRSRRWGRRARRTLVTAAILFAVTQLLYAIGDTGGSELGQTPPSLSWITLTDAKDINVWQYELGINFNADIFDPGRTLSAMVTEYLWAVYRGLAVISIWFLDWVFSFDWLTIITGPLTEISNALRDIITAFGLAPTFMVVAAFAGGLFILRGKIARGVYEICVAAMVVAVSASVLSNPVDIVAGPNGWIYETRDVTMDLVAEMGNSAASDPSAITSQLITTFVRQPSQLVSFGQILDGTACEQAYDDAVASGPHGYDDTIRNAVTACNESAGKYAEAPSGGMVSAAFIQSPAGLVVLLMAVLIGGAVMLALISTVLAAIGALINLVMAVLPGGARRPLAQSFAEVAIGLVTFVFSLFFLTVFLQTIQGIFAASAGEPSKAFVVVNIFMVLGLVFYMRYRRKLKTATDRLADWMSTRPGAPAARPLPASRGNAGAIAAAGVYGGVKLLSSPRGRRAVKTAGTAGLAAATGNPALAGRVIFNVAASKAAAKAPRPGPRPTPPNSGAPTTPATSAETTSGSGQGGVRRRSAARSFYRPTTAGSRRPGPRTPARNPDPSPQGGAPASTTTATPETPARDTSAPAAAARPGANRPRPARGTYRPTTSGTRRRATRNQPRPEESTPPRSRTQQQSPQPPRQTPPQPRPPRTTTTKPPPAAPTVPPSRRSPRGSRGKGHRR